MKTIEWIAIITMLCFFGFMLIIGLTNYDNENTILKADNMILEIKVTEYEMQMIAKSFEELGVEYKNDPNMIRLYDKWTGLQFKYGDFYNKNIDKLKDSKYNIWE